MKLCPQCEFIYEDDQTVCDMDRQSLVYDDRSEILPGKLAGVIAVRRTNSRRRVAMVPVVAALLCSALLFIGYCASSSVLFTKAVSPFKNSDTRPTGMQQELVASANSGTQAGITSSQPQNPDSAAGPVNSQADELKKSLNQQSLREQMAASAYKAPTATGNSLTTPTSLPSLRQLKPLPRLAPPPRLASSTSATQGLKKQTSSGARQMALVVDVKNDSKKKPSRVGSFLKKTANILKRPFRS